MVGARFHLVPLIPAGSTCHTSGRTAKDRANEVEPRPNWGIYENGTLKMIRTENGYYDYSTNKYYFYVRDHLGNNRVVTDQTATAVQSTQYYPFGMAFATSTGQNGQRFKYNDKELDLMHGLNMYDYSARGIDMANPRFTTQDPLAEKYYSISPYAYCNNNPLKYIDPTGMEWLNKAAEEYAKKLSQEMANKTKSEQKRLDKLNDKIVKNELKGKDVSKDQDKATGIQENIDNLKTGIDELTAMGNTKDQVFTYNMTEGSVGYTGVNEDGVIVMDISGNGSTPNGIHESSHGYDMWKNGRYTTSNFLDGEIKAYGRQFSFDSNSMPASNWYKSINGLSDINNSYILGIQSNGDYIYGKIYHGETYNYKHMQRAFKIAKQYQW